jgi:hypothetical protein
LVSGSSGGRGGITGSLLGTASRAVTASYAEAVSGFINFPAGLVVTGSLIVSSSGIQLTGSKLFGTSSWAESSSVAVNSLTAITASYTPITSSIIYVVDGGGQAITTGVKGDLIIPFACRILEWALLADQSGSVTVDIWKDTYANYPPTSVDSITGSAAVSITNNAKNQSSTLTGWTTTIAASDILRFNVSSAATITRLTITLDVAR